MESTAVEPLSWGVQIALRLPLLIIGLAGVLIALLSIRRLGVAAGLLTAAGSLMVAADMAVNVLWVLHLRTMSSDGDFDLDSLNAVNNAYLLGDAVLITVGVALLVAGLLARKRPEADAPVPAPGAVPWPAPPMPPMPPVPPGLPPSAP
ncbi:hypothetical protein [Dactylosporangium sp. CA-092794]|uniref:hypothetical protein n=1 Tax=Dactylosporangium sp. CA-092794 TaxID=3239929 RepID=UPI003D8FB7A3